MIRETWRLFKEHEGDAKEYEGDANEHECDAKEGPITIIMSRDHRSMANYGWSEKLSRMRYDHPNSLYDDAAGIM